MTAGGTKAKPWSRTTANEIAFYYAKGCKVFPPMYTMYIDQLSQLEREHKFCFTPTAILERYHLELRRRIEQRIRRITKAIA